VEQDLYELLPATMQEMADTIGLDNTLKVIEQYASERFNVPVRDPTPKMIERLGTDLARTIVQQYSRELLTIPKCCKLKNHFRDLEIAKLRAGGKSIPELVRLFGLTRRHIERQLAIYTSGGDRFSNLLIKSL
jgi:hypothetical protein